MRTFRRWRWVAVPFALLPCACTGIFTLTALPVAFEAGSPQWTVAILVGWVILSMLWITGGLLGWALGTFANIGAAVTVARERETHNWAMLRLTAMPIREIVAAKLAALTRLIFWPAVVALGLEVASFGLSGVALIVGVLVLGASAPQDFRPEMQIGVIAAILGGEPVITIYAIVATTISLLYNCAVGLLTSTLTRTTASAVILSFGIHFGINLFVFVPVQQLTSIMVQLLGGALALATQSPLAFFIFVPIVSFVLPIALELVIGAAAFLIAMNQAQNIIE